MPKTFRISDPTVPEMQLYRAGDDEGCAGTIAMCTRDRIAAGTAISWLQTDYSFLPPGKHINRLIVQGHILTLQRNECIQRMQGDWILFIDDDMTWQPDAVGNLVKLATEDGLDMVGGLCFSRGEPYAPTMFMREGPTLGAYIALEDWHEGDTVEVDATGMAFVLITRRLLEHVAGEFPPYEERINRRPPSYFIWDDSGFGEDLRFCQMVKAAGRKIFVDTNTKIGHISEITVTREHHLRELAYRGLDDYERVKTRNDRFGLPTMTPFEAKQRLQHG